MIYFPYTYNVFSNTFPFMGWYPPDPFWSMDYYSPVAPLADWIYSTQSWSYPLSYAFYVPATPVVYSFWPMTGVSWLIDPSNPLPSMPETNLADFISFDSNNPSSQPA